MGKLIKFGAAGLSSAQEDGFVVVSSPAAPSFEFVDELIAVLESTKVLDNPKVKATTLIMAIMFFDDCIQKLTKELDV